ncbi:MAG: GH3 auxin-responsive promoter family protein [Leptolyngbyaceae cyanobacterium bins.59]|nr:GH3 auxin-responsive promoter family protein [Leptolyngbyaceae cyanobacterium bins.59]
MRRFIQGFGLILEASTRQFYRALENSQLAQFQVRQTICDRLINSDYGKFLGIGSIADWERVPIVEYEEIAPWIGGKNLGHRIGTTPEPVIFYERTSGSRGPIKFIPYTRSLQQSFNHLFCIWAGNLIRHGPPFTTGKVYACVSPQFGRGEDIDSEVAVGLENDADYLTGWLSWLLRPFLVTTPKLNQINSLGTFKQQLCLTLLQEERLEILSLWSPSFLTVHLHYIQTHAEFFQAQVRHKISVDRLQLLQEPTISWSQLWPHLKLISCWESGSAADSAGALRNLFPHVLVQGKGLLATEAPLTVPLIETGGFLPLLDEVFFEFESADGTLHLLHQLQSDQIYSLILSQKGGLYRYRIGDRVRVTSWYRDTPCLEFVGRDQTVSDLVGEKLQEEFVQSALSTLALETTQFRCLVPVQHPTPHYVFLLDRTFLDPHFLAVQVDRKLSQSYRYREARLLGQLAPVRVLVNARIPEILTAYQVRSGKKWGDVKYPLLETRAIDPAVLAEMEPQQFGIL